ncbi:hypothetical protein GCM10023199_03440 [Actinomycetospora chibensis]
MTGRHGRPDAPENGTPSGRRIVRMSATPQRPGVRAGRPVAGRGPTAGRPVVARPVDRAGGRPGDHGDAETERHYASAWLRPEQIARDAADADAETDVAGTAFATYGSDRGSDRRDPEPEPEPDPEADPGWLLGDDPPAPGGDALTEALPQGRAERSRRRLLWPGIAVLLVVVLAGGVFFARDLLPIVFPPDYDGPGTGRVVVEVADGSSTREIGEQLVADDVVASARSFGDAAEENPNGRGIQPGFYELRRQMSSAGAVEALLDPASRVGRLEIRSGVQLDDTVGAGDSTVPGVLSLISRATCTVDDAGAERCASVADLRAAMADTDPAELGVPTWALDGVRRAEPARRLEGLLAPGTVDLAPGIGAREALEQVVRASVPRLESSGLVEEAQARGVPPYDALIVASLAEREGVAADFGKVAQVIYNRLAVPMRLQFDSTVNYPLDRQTLLTSPFDRARPGPYNTYLNLGLTPTPIGAVSPEALRAALEPTPGPWVYFVKCQTDGISCFAVAPEEHDANRRLAQERGVY